MQQPQAPSQSLHTTPPGAPNLTRLSTPLLVSQAKEGKSGICCLVHLHLNPDDLLAKSEESFQAGLWWRSHNASAVGHSCFRAPKTAWFNTLCLKETGIKTRFDSNIIPFNHRRKNVMQSHYVILTHLFFFKFVSTWIHSLLFLLIFCCIKYCVSQEL